MNFLQELSVYINGKCNNRCKHCKNYSHQTLFCGKSKFELEKNDIDKIFSIIEEYGILKVNILGGDIFLYKYFSYILDKLENIDIYKCLYINSKNVNIKLMNRICILLIVYL